MLVDDAAGLLLGARVVLEPLELGKLEQRRLRHEREVWQQVERHSQGVAPEQAVKQAGGAGRCQRRPVLPQLVQAVNLTDGTEGLAESHGIDLRGSRCGRKPGGEHRAGLVRCRKETQRERPYGKGRAELSRRSDTKNEWAHQSVMAVMAPEGTRPLAGHRRRGGMSH